jgi:phenylacetate-CoA ligase
LVFVSSSSGSTGVPTVSPFTAQDFDEWQYIEARLFWAAGIRPSDRYVHALNFTLFVGGPDVIGAQRLGAAMHLGGHHPVGSPAVYHEGVCGHGHLDHAFLCLASRRDGEGGGDRPARDLAIRRIIAAGEPGGSIPGTRKAIEDLWNAKLFDFYGISDIYGACAGQCSFHEGLHLVEDQILLEVLDRFRFHP